jgi:caffeoyl-CoA O-methyltransferase
MKSFIVSEKIENYCERHLASESSLFQELAKETHLKMDMPQMQVGHLEGKFLKWLCSLIKAKKILEIGTFTGYSTLSMAEALAQDGEIITLDIDPIATSLAKKYWKQSPYGKRISLQLGDAIKLLPQIKGSFDLIFLDADKENYPCYWELLLPKLRSGGLIVVDNVLWSGRVLEPKDKSDKAIAELNQMIAKDARVEAVMIPLRDGIFLCRKI